MKLKLSYEKESSGCVDVYHDIQAHDPQTGAAFVLTLGDESRPGSACVGFSWFADHTRLPVYARAIAFFNGRKNVCSTEAECGVLY